MNEARHRDEHAPLKVGRCSAAARSARQVVRLLHEQADDLAARVGAPVELVGVAVRRLDAPRDVDVPAELFTTDAAGAGRAATTSTWSSR